MLSLAFNARCCAGVTSSFVPAGTTVGVRDPGSGQWRFYTQVWKRVSSSYQLCDPPVIRFA